MNCEKFLAVANDLARDHNPGPDRDGFASMPLMEVNERESALAHVAECDSCAALWDEERRLTLGLQNLAREMESVSAPLQVEERLLAAFRERGKVMPTVRPFPIRRQQSRYWLAAVAAALLIVLGIIVVRGRLFNSSRPQLAVDGGKHPSESPIVPDKVSKESTESGPKQTETAGTVIPPRRNPRNRLASFQRGARHLNESANAVAGAAKAGENNEERKEVATDFFPIGYGTAPNLQDGGQLLRVELPRSAVARFGLPVNMDRASERVKADVLVGADGLAQAIRFIH